MKPHTPNQKKVRFRYHNVKECQKRYYDQRHTVKDLPPLSTGDGVWIPDLSVHIPSGIMR